MSENKVEKSLRWVVNQIPDFEPKTNEEKMLLNIKFYCNAGANEISRLTEENNNLSIELEVAQRDVENLTKTLEEANDEIKALEAENSELRATLSKMETVEKELRARLENAVELPVKRGDTIYCLIGFVEFLTIQEWQVQEIRLLVNGKYFLTCGHEDTDDYCGMSSEHFGLWWFTDRSEAEARLAELRGGKE